MLGCIELNESDLEWPAGCGNPQQGTGVRAREDSARHHAVAFHHLLLHARREVWERLVERFDLGGYGSLLQHRRVREFVEDRSIAFPESIDDPPPGDHFALVAVHGCTSEASVRLRVASPRPRAPL